MNNQPSQNQNSQFFSTEHQTLPTEDFFTAGVGLQSPDSKLMDSPNLNNAEFRKSSIENNVSDDPVFVQPSLPPGYNTTPSSVSPTPLQPQEASNVAPTIASLPRKEPDIVGFAEAVRTMRAQNQTEDQAA